MKQILLMTLILFFESSYARSECDYNLILGNVTVLLTNAPQVVPQNTNIHRSQNSPDGKCRNYRIYFGKGLGYSYSRKAFSLSGRSMNYNLHPDINKNGILKEFNDAVNVNEYLQGYAPNKFTTYSNRFFVSTPGLDDGVAVSGIYLDVVQVSIYSFNENNNHFTFQETLNLTLVFMVNKKIQVSLVDETGTFDPHATNKVLDFGTITQGSVKAADLRVVSNTPYQVKMSSMNNGALKQGSLARIPYALKVNGYYVGLSGASPVTFGSGNPTGPAGDRYNIRVQITGETEGLPAGLYQDAVTITAIAN
jgi:hypothetical protein